MNVVKYSSFLYIHARVASFCRKLIDYGLYDGFNYENIAYLNAISKSHNKKNLQKKKNSLPTYPIFQSSVIGNIAIFLGLSLNGFDALSKQQQSFSHLNKDNLITGTPLPNSQPLPNLPISLIFLEAT